MASRSKSSSFLSNPVVQRIARINESGEEHVTHGGIALKCLFFMVMVAVGVALEFTIHGMFRATEENLAQGIMTNDIEGIGMFVAVGVALVASILAAVFTKVTPFFGSLSCISCGYLVTCLANMSKQFQAPALMAMVFTFAIVFAMQLLFATGKFTVSHKFRTAITAVLSAWVLAGALIAVLCTFAPQFAVVGQFLSDGGVISIGISMVGIIIAVMFLISDFSDINEAVNNKLPKKYEWVAAFSLTMTIIWLYMEIFNLLCKLKDNN